MDERISVWEGEGGSLRASTDIFLSGTANQIEWAKQIRRQVNAEFDRVARLLRDTAARQSMEHRIDTQAIITILEDKRLEVMSYKQAGYFIHDWQELRDQVRQIIMKDDRYKSIKARRGF